MDLLVFEPIYQDRVWGGNNLATELGRTLPHDGPIGEAWEIVDRPEAQSVHIRSQKTLAELLSTHSELIMGPEWSSISNRRFPILVKWLDCQERLSLQVHPPAHVAHTLNGEPKTECWFIAKAKPEASLFIGLKATTTRQDFESVLTQSGGAGLAPLIHRVAVSDGESILLESGRIHAIDAGNLILEIQQNSDTTYRVYDWDRVGLDGQPRQLHIHESLASINFEDFEPTVLSADPNCTERIIAQCQEFRIRQVNLSQGESITIEANREPSIISVVSGRLKAEPKQGLKNEAHGDESAHQHGHRKSHDELEGSLQAQSTHIDASVNVLCPYAWSGRLEALETTTLLITDQFF